MLVGGWWPDRWRGVRVKQDIIIALLAIIALEELRGWWGAVVDACERNLRQWRADRERSQK